jgi:hypothetical protein
MAAETGAVRFPNFNHKERFCCRFAAGAAKGGRLMHLKIALGG